MVGLGEVCSHVGAILFYIEATYRIKSCTELQCAWKMPATVDSIPYAKIADIDFVKPKSVIKPMKRGVHLNNDCDMMTDPADVELKNESGTSSSYSRVGSVNPNLISTTDNEASAFFDNVLKHKPCILSLLSPYCDSYIPTESERTTSLDIPGLNNLYKPENEELTYKELLDVGEDIVFELTSEQISEIEKHTRAQHGCDLWFKHRAGRITASKMKAACHTDPASPSISLIKQICYPKQSSFSTSATKWGCEHEDIARQLYCSEMQKQHTDFDCFTSGLVISEDYPFIAATPDGFRHCACCGEGVVEIKCPYCTNNSDPELAAFLKDGSLLSSHQYYYQIQTQMLVCQVEFGDFIVCTFPNDTPTLFRQRIEMDVDFLSQCIMKSGDLYKVAIMPELLGRWFTRSCVMTTIDGREDLLNYKYCYCKEELGGQMVHCDNDDECPYGEWFHLSCLKLKNVPRVKRWYCPQCRKESKQKK